MSFRQKLMLCMVWLLTMAYSIGGTVLIEQSFDRGLEEQLSAARSSYRMALQTVELVNTVDLQQNLSVITAALRSMDTSAGWSALRLRDKRSSYCTIGSGFYEAELPEQAQQVSFSQNGTHLYQISSRLSKNGLRLDAVYSLQAIYDTRAAQIMTYRRSLLLLLAVGSLLSYFVAFWLTKPLAKVSAASCRLAGGDLRARAELNSADEVGRLAEDFNTMADRLEETISELTEAMQRQEQFMGSFAHELKTPMTSVIGYAELLRGGGLDEQEAMEAANYIYSEGKRLESLSMKLLELLVMKHQEQQRCKTELGSWLEALTEQLRPVYPQRIEVSAQPCSAMIEPELFRSLILNLIDNAGKAQSSEIRIILSKADKYCSIQIEDNGIGIPTDSLDRLTEPFYRVDKARSRLQGGTGLGLALCQRIAQLHGAELTFASEPGKGTVVTVGSLEVRE